RQRGKEEMPDRCVRVIAESVGVLDLLEHLAVEPVVRLAGPALELGVDAEPHVAALAFWRSARRRRPGSASSRPPLSPLGRSTSTTAINVPITITVVPVGRSMGRPRTAKPFSEAGRNESSPLIASAPTTAPSRLPDPPTTSIAS